MPQWPLLRKKGYGGLRELYMEAAREGLLLSPPVVSSDSVLGPGHQLTVSTGLHRQAVFPPGSVLGTVCCVREERHAPCSPGSVRLFALQWEALHTRPAGPLT